MQQSDQTPTIPQTESSQQADAPKTPAPKYEPPKLSKFDKLEKLIVSGE